MNYKREPLDVVLRVLAEKAADAEHMYLRERNAVYGNGGTLETSRSLLERFAHHTEAAGMLYQAVLASLATVERETEAQADARHRYVRSEVSRLLADTFGYREIERKELRGYMERNGYPRKTG